MQIYLVVLLSILILSGCEHKAHILIQDSPSTEVPENVDLGCSYFHFLLGNQADGQNDYDLALSSYEKALLCDARSSHIASKIPIILLKQGKITEAIKRLEEGISLAPENRDFIILLAQLYTQNDEVENAIALYTTLLSKEPKNLDILLRLGLLYQSKELYNEAEEIFNKALKIDESSYDAHLYLAQTYALNNKPLKAKESYINAMRYNWSVALAYEIGEFYTNNNWYSEALNMYSIILDYDQGEENAVLLKVQALIQLDRVKEARTELQDRRLYSTNPEYIDLTTSSILFEQHKKSEGILLLEEMVKRYSSVKAIQALALLYYQDGDYRTAIQWVNKIPLDSDHYDQGLLIKIQVLIHENAIDAARNLLKNRISLNDNIPILHNLLASLFIKLNQKSQAERAYLDGLKSFPDNIDISYEFALFLEQNKRTQEALNVMESLLDNEPNNPEALNFIGYTWADNNLHLEKALEYTLKAAEMVPDNGFIRDSVGWCYYRLGDFSEAIKALLEAINLAPNDPNIYEHLGDAYQKNNQLDKAIEAYRNAFDLYNTEEKKKSIQQKLDSLEQ